MMRHFLLSLLSLSVVVGRVPSMAQSARAAAPALSALTVSIAAPVGPDQYAHHRRYITLSSKDPHFYVVIQNTSGKPLNLFGEDCVEGCGNLTLELSAIDDKILSPPIVVARPRPSFGSNAVRIDILEPGDMMVRDVRLSENLYANFPAMRPGESHMIKMQAIYNSPGEAVDGYRAYVNYPIWSGEASSAPETYVFQKVVP